MSNTLTKELTCAEIINTYLFKNVWNEPVSEYRSNIVPAKFTARAVVGSFATTEGYIALPTEREAYFVWTVGVDELRIALNLPDTTWVDTATCVNEYNTKLDFYSVQGKMFHKCAVYIRYNTDRRVMFIAAKKDMLYRCTDMDTISANRVFLTTYFDSDQVNDIRVVSFKVGDVNSSSFQMQIDTLLQGARSETICYFKNGVEVTQGSLDLVYGEYYDVVIDENIEFAFDVDLVTEHEAPAYLSIKDEMWKQLIHIPKELNPENRIYTHDTCDFYIRRKEGEMPYGLFMHRVAPASVTQVTHNDFGIPLVVIDAYRDYLQEQEIEIHVVVRRHNKDNLLIREANYLQLLYVDVHTDGEIINILCGNGPENIPWWRADQLEQSLYVQMMFDTPNQMRLNNELMDDYIDALGYHQVINLLCQRSLDTVVDEHFNHTLVLDKPLLYSEYEVYPLMYINGKHIDFDKVTYSNGADNKIFITLDESIVARAGDTISTVFYLSGNNVCKIFTLDTDTLELEVPYVEPLIYMLQSNPDNEVVIGVQNEKDSGYVQLSTTDNVFTITSNASGGSRIVFNSTYIGAIFVIQNRYATYRISEDITPKVTAGKTLAVSLSAVDGVSESTAPILNHECVTVFYNTKYLVEGVDYTVVTYTNREGNICDVEVVIQTMDHYTDTLNRIDILVSQDVIRDVSHGFMLEDKLYDDSPVNLQYSNTTTVHVDGLLERNSVNKGNYTLLPSGLYKAGCIWEIQTAVPKVISDFIANYSSKNDDYRLEVMNEYFSENKEPEPDLIVLERKHRIYSFFLNEVIAQILNGNIGISVDPDTNRLDQALGTYTKFKDADVVYSQLDQRFVDYYPQYVNYEVDTGVKAAVDYVIDVYLPKNLYPSLHSVAEECDTYQLGG